MTVLEDWQRAPWMFNGPPFRFHVHRVRPSGVTLWVASPIEAPNLLPVVTRIYGRRVIDLLCYTELAATWREAMDYATKGTPPRPIAEVYPQWCGLA